MRGEDGRVHERVEIKMIREHEKMDNERNQVKAKKFVIDDSKADLRDKEVVEKDMQVTGLRMDTQGRFLWRLDAKTGSSLLAEENGFQ